LRDRIDLAFLVGVRTERRAVVEIGAAIPLAIPCILLDVGGDAARLFAALGGEAASLRISATSAKRFSTSHRKKASHTLSPLPCSPTLSMPSFQSQEPISGRPCSPKRKPWRMARTQWSYSVPRSPERAGSRSRNPPPA
jgi:hypothetical protein